MKKLLAIILATSFTLSLAACGKGEKTKVEVKDAESQVVENFEDFKDKLDEIGKVKETITEEGGLVVELETPTSPKNEEEIKPAIPTIDKVKPSEPDKNDMDTNQQKPEDDETVIPSTPQKPIEPQEPIEPEVPVEPEKPVEPEVPVEPEKPDELIKPAKPTYTYTKNQKHQKLHYTKRYLYNILNDEQKGWYRQIDDVISQVGESVKINANLAENRNYYIYYLYMADNPEYFYLASTVSIYNYGNGTSALEFAYAIGKEEGEFCGYSRKLTEELRKKILDKKAIFDAEVNRIISTIPANAPDVWKERLIYERILLDSYYNLSAQWDGLANDNWTAYGILVNKYGVCESYSEAFQVLCLYAGIKCMGVVGTAGGGHKWNVVELDGEWYMCDITFDDPIGGDPNDAYHYYFNRTSEWFSEHNHNWEDCDWPVPECNSTKYYFDNYFN